MQCMNCEEFNGDCGHHFIDSQGHIHYGYPSKKCCDYYGNCNYYKGKKNKYQVQIDLIESGNANALDLGTVKEALEYTMLNTRW